MGVLCVGTSLLFESIPTMVLIVDISEHEGKYVFRRKKNPICDFSRSNALNRSNNIHARAQCIIATAYLGNLGRCRGHCGLHVTVAARL